MGPFVLGGEFQRLEEAYTSVTQSDIFNVNPFKTNGDIKIFNAALRVISGRDTIGESLPLKALVRKFFSVELYNKLINSDFTFGATVVSLTTARSEIKILRDHSYNDIVDWIWASANNPIFMSLLDKDNQVWVDGGLKDYASISYVLQEDLADEIDVILHNTTEITSRNVRGLNGVFDYLLRVIGVFVSDVIQNDIENAKLQVQLDHEVKVNFYYMDQSQIDLIGGNSLIFDKNKMSIILQQGFESVVNGTIKRSACKVDKTGQILPLTA